MDTTLEADACSAVALEFLVTNEPSTTYQMDINLVLEAAAVADSSTTDMSNSLKKALQFAAPSLTSCAEMQLQTADLVKGAKPKNVVFGDTEIKPGTYFSFRSTLRKWSQNGSPPQSHTLENLPRPHHKSKLQ